MSTITNRGVTTQYITTINVKGRVYALEAERISINNITPVELQRANYILSIDTSGDTAVSSWVPMTKIPYVTLEGSSAQTPVSSAAQLMTVCTCTLAQYEALASKDPNTLYIITG